MKTASKVGQVLALLLTLASASAAARDRNHLTYGDLLARNKTNLSHLSVDMDKKELFAEMKDYWTEVRDGRVGNPYRSETLQRGDDTYEVLYYLTQAHPFATPLQDSQATPVVVKNGLVSGWGWNALEALRSSPHK